MLYSVNMGIPQGMFNLGNQLFVIASLLGMAKRYGTRVIFQNEWKYKQAFNTTDVAVCPSTANIFLREPTFACHLDFFDKFSKIAKDEVIGVGGYLQSELYWKDYENDIRRNLSFSDELRVAMHASLVSRQIDTNHFVAISVRRGDFVTDPNHYLLPKDYYINAYRKHFDGCGVYVFSDDINWCRHNLAEIADKVFFADGLNGIQQLCLMSMFKNFVISNSTFSWWGAYLSKEVDKKIVRPFHHFDGLLKTTSIADHYPMDWVVYDHIKENESH